MSSIPFWLGLWRRRNDTEIIFLSLYLRIFHLWVYLGVHVHISDRVPRLKLTIVHQFWLRFISKLQSFYFWMFHLSWLCCVSKVDFRRTLLSHYGLFLLNFKGLRLRNNFISFLPNFIIFSKTNFLSLKTGFLMIGSRQVHLIIEIIISLFFS